MGDDEDDLLKSIPPAIKSALTRAYNGLHLKLSSASVPLSKKSVATLPMASMDGEILEEADSESDHDEPAPVPSKKPAPKKNAKEPKGKKEPKEPKKPKSAKEPKEKKEPKKPAAKKASNQLGIFDMVKKSGDEPPKLFFSVSNQPRPIGVEIKPEPKAVAKPTTKIEPKVEPKNEPKVDSINVGMNPEPNVGAKKPVAKSTKASPKPRIAKSPKTLCESVLKKKVPKAPKETLCGPKVSAGAPSPESLNTKKVPKSTKTRGVKRSIVEDDSSSSEDGYDSSSDSVVATDNSSSDNSDIDDDDDDDEPNEPKKVIETKNILVQKPNIASSIMPKLVPDVIKSIPKESLQNDFKEVKETKETEERKETKNMEEKNASCLSAPKPKAPSASTKVSTPVTKSAKSKTAPKTVQAKLSFASFVVKP